MNYFNARVLEVNLEAVLKGSVNLKKPIVAILHPLSFFNLHVKAPLFLLNLVWYFTALLIPFVNLRVKVKEKETS